MALPVGIRFTNDMAIGANDAAEVVAPSSDVASEEGGCNEEEVPVGEATAAQRCCME